MNECYYFVESIRLVLDDEKEMVMFIQIFERYLLFCRVENFFEELFKKKYNFVI